jgi:hypothetical protein
VVGNPAIAATYALFNKVQKDMTPRDRWQWRLQQLMYRSNYDQFIQVRATIERKGAAAAWDVLAADSGSANQTRERGRRQTPVAAKIEAAMKLIAEAETASKLASADLWTELRVWAEAVFQSVHEQWSVPIYGGEYTRRGNNLDTARLPLSDMPFIRFVSLSVFLFFFASSRFQKFLVLITWSPLVIVLVRSLARMDGHCSWMCAFQCHYGVVKKLSVGLSAT